MAQAFTRPALGGGIYSGPVPLRGDEYTRPLAPLPPYAVRPAPANWGQSFQPPRPVPPVYQPPVSSSAPTVWSGPNARPVLPLAPWGMPPAKHGLGGRRWAWIAAGGAVALAVTVGVVAAIANGSDDIAGSSSRPAVATASPSPAVVPPPPPAPTVIDDAQLPRMVPLEAHAADVVGAVALETIAKTSGPGLLADFTDPAGCVGALVPATQSAYDGSGVRATYVQALHDPDRHQLHLVVNTVSTFDSASQATQFATTQAVAWQGCQAAPIVLDANRGTPTTWVVSDVTQRGEMLTDRGFVRDTGAHCQRALTTKLNVVVDTQVCTDTVTDAAAKLATEIAGHVGQAT
jgi:hypothetical protein